MFLQGELGHLAMQLLPLRRNITYDLTISVSGLRKQNDWYGFGYAWWPCG